MPTNFWLGSFILSTLLGCGADRGATADPPPVRQVASPPAVPASLTAAEIASLRFMREEEKLAHDVYVALEGQGFVFARIQQAERRHFEIIGSLLERYGVPDPAAGRGPGELQDPALRALYLELVERGKRSQLDAFAVGLEIEELDIADLERAKRGVSRADILRVYDNLQRASRNHLRAFHRNLVALGGTYTPKHLERAAFERIAREPMERGMGMGMGPRGGMGPGPRP